MAVGGDGTLQCSYNLSKLGLRIVGVPKTIDNDVRGTELTFGFTTAVTTATEAIDKLHTTAQSHKRVMVTEVMGRHAGWIALHGGLAGGASVILIPEIPFDLDKVAEAILRREEAGITSTQVVVAEGARPKDGRQMLHVTGSGEYKLGGMGEQVAREIAKRTGKETRTCVLGHIQRGGAPTTKDRILGTQFGVKAVELIKEGKFGHMVSYQNFQVTEVDIAEAVHRLRLVKPDSQMVQMARAVGISFGD